MKKESNYIVQYVGFKTGMDSIEFIKRWTPFATGFKSAGIKKLICIKHIPALLQKSEFRN